MRTLMNKPFARFVRKNALRAEDLFEAVENAERGLLAADLGGGIIKQRIARSGTGKSGGFRVLIFFRAQGIAIFVHGFAKNEKANIRPDELKALRKLAGILMAYSREEIERAIAAGILMEVTGNV